MVSKKTQLFEEILMFLSLISLDDCGCRSASVEAN
jgi:hypothetical protein